MIYFDTDVLINLLISQDSAKHQKAKTLFNSATDNEEFLFRCSPLMVYSQAKLKPRVWTLFST